MTGKEIGTDLREQTQEKPGNTDVLLNYNWELPAIALARDGLCGFVRVYKQTKHWIEQQQSLSAVMVLKLYNKDGKREQIPIFLAIKESILMFCRSKCRFESY